MNARRWRVRKEERRTCSIYLRLTNHRTGEIVGDVADISVEGFRLESSKRIPPNTLFTFRMDLPPEITSKPYMVFTARSRWNRTDRLDARLYDTGFEIIAMDLDDCRLFERVFERYGSRSAGGDSGTVDWLKK